MRAALLYAVTIVLAMVIGASAQVGYQVTAALVQAIDGSIGSPSISFANATNTGFYYTGTADELGMTVGGVDLGIFKVQTGTLTATEVRKLNATPVEVIASPGTGQAIIVHSVQWMMDYGGTAFDSVGAGDDLRLLYDGDSVIISDCDRLNCINGAGTSDTFGMAWGPVNFAGYNPIADKAINATLKTSEWAAADDDANGNSVIRYLIIYRLITLDLSL